MSGMLKWCVLWWPYWVGREDCRVASTPGFVLRGPLQFQMASKVEGDVIEERCFCAQCGFQNQCGEKVGGCQAGGLLRMKSARKAFWIKGSE